MKVSPEILDRLPPQDLDAEKGVLGSLLLDRNMCDHVAVILQAEDFYADGNQKLFGHLMAMHNERQRIDIVLLKERLKKEGDFEAIGGAAYLAEVAQSAPYAANAGYYAQIVAGKSARRQMIHAATELLRNAYDEYEDTAQIIFRTERALGAIGSGKADGPVPFQEVVSQAIEQIDEVMQAKQGRGLPTGMLDFDRFYGGLFPGELTILAARPGVGKTALATQIAAYSACKARPVYFASAEMSQVEIAIRLLCGTAGVSSQRVRGGSLEPNDVKRLTECSRLLAPAALYIDDRPGLGTAEIRRGARRILRQGLRLIVVDYLQLLKPVDKRVNREEQVATMARALKLLARELDVPVLCLCQLNRQAAVDIWPDLHHLRESGAIEQDADVVTFLHKGPSNHNEEEKRAKPNDACWIVRKNRNGETGRVRMRWSSTLVGFESIEETLF